MNPVRDLSGSIFAKIRIAEGNKFAEWNIEKDYDIIFQSHLIARKTILFGFQLLLSI